MTFNIDEMELVQIKDVLKMLVRAINNSDDRINELEDRVLQLEMVESGDYE